MFPLNHHWRKVKGMLLKKKPPLPGSLTASLPLKMYGLSPPGKEISSSNHWISRGIHPQKTKMTMEKTSPTITKDVINFPIKNTLQGINISHLGNRKIIFKMPFLGDMLVPWRVTVGDFSSSRDRHCDLLKNWQAGECFPPPGWIEPRYIILLK